MFKHRIFTSLFTLLFIVGFAFTFSQPSHAAIVSPPFIDIDLQRGAKYSGQFSIFFRPEDSDTLYLSIQKLVVKDLTGEKAAERQTTDEQTLANWITLSTNVLRRPRNVTYTNGDNEVKVNYTIQVPENAEVGGDYAVVIITKLPVDGNTSGTDILFAEDVTYQVLGKIAGEINYDSKVQDFRVKDRQFLFSRIPVNLETIFENKGNTHVIPRGNIEIFQGEQKIANVSLNPGQVRLFPNSTRLFQSDWVESEQLPTSFWEEVIYEIRYFKIGYFEARLQGFAGNQPAFYASTGFIIFPWHLALVIVVIILIIVGGLKLKSNLNPKKKTTTTKKRK